MAPIIAISDAIAGALVAGAFSLVTAVLTILVQRWVTRPSGTVVRGVNFGARPFEQAGEALTAPELVRVWLVAWAFVEHGPAGAKLMLSGVMAAQEASEHDGRPGG